MHLSASLWSTVSALIEPFSVLLLAPTNDDFYLEKESDPAKDAFKALMYLLKNR